jgi:hypothetical protein
MAENVRYTPPPHMDAAALIRRADALMNRWAEKYGMHNAQWLPPAGVVKWQEDAAIYLAAHSMPAPTCGVPVVRVGEHNGGDYDMTHRTAGVKGGS